MNKRFFLSFLVLLILSFNKLNGQPYPKVEVVESLDTLNLKAIYPNPKDFESVTDALSLIQRYLKQTEISKTDSFSDFGQDILRVVFDFASSQNSLYEVISLTTSLPKSATFSVNAYLFFNKSPVKLYRGMLEIGVDLQSKEVIFPVYNTSYTTVDYANVSYHVKSSSLEAFSLNMKKGESYTSYVLKTIKEKCPDFRFPDKRLDYVIADGNYKGLEYFGIYHHFMQSRYLYKGNTVIDVLSNGFYKHEIIHYVFSNYKFCRFLTEGIATYLSGGENYYGASPSIEIKEIKNKIRSDKQFASLLDHKDSISSFLLSYEMYQISALLIHNYHKKVGDAKFYRVLINDLAAFSDEEALQFFCKELNIKRMSEFLLIADEPCWDEIFDQTKIQRVALLKTQSMSDLR